MPLYEYRCESCRQLTEILQKFSDAPLTICEKCGGSLERLISAPGLHFKGTGWYVTDYARAGSGVSSANGGKSEKGEAKSETKSEKTESKPEKTTTSTTSSDKS